MHWIRGSLVKSPATVLCSFPRCYFPETSKAFSFSFKNILVMCVHFTICFFFQPVSRFPNSLFYYVAVKLTQIRLTGFYNSFTARKWFQSENLLVKLVRLISSHLKLNKPVGGIFPKIYFVLLIAQTCIISVRF